MKIYLLLIAGILAITPYIVPDKAEANKQFNKVNISNNQELNVNYREIIKKVQLINSFYKRKFGKKAKIAITGLNPHCESPVKVSEEKRIIIPAINSLKRNGIAIKGPFPADTIFLKENRNKYDVIIGMYHDQVLGPIKSIFEFDAINITLVLPFNRVSPDHGPNESMLGKNKSNYLSLLNSIKFLDF